MPYLASKIYAIFLSAFPKREQLYLGIINLIMRFLYPFGFKLHITFSQVGHFH